MEFEINQRFIKSNSQETLNNFNLVGNELSVFILNVESFMSTTNTYQYTLKELSSVIGNLSESVNGDTNVFNECASIFSELSDYHVRLRETMLENVLLPLQKFQKEKMDLSYLEELNDDMDRTCVDYNNILEWFPLNPKKKKVKKDNELDETKVLLSKATTSFINEIEDFKKDVLVEIGRGIKRFMNGFVTFFRKSRKSTKNIMKNYPDPDINTIVPIPLIASHKNEGFLFKMHKNSFKLVWACLDINNQFIVSKNWMSTEPMEQYLLELSNIKPLYDTKYHNCFFITETVKNKVMYKAVSDEDFDRWITLLQEGIANALSVPLVDSTKKKLIRTNSKQVLEPKVVMERLHNTHPSNNLCADCGKSDPKWVSINLGVIICINCSGVHRSLGTHISKVRSLAMDTLSEYLVDMFLELNNDVLNSFYERNEFSVPRPDENSSRDTRESFIRAKYEEKRFVHFPDVEISDELLVQSISEKNIIGIFQALIEGADANLIISETKKCVLHLAVTLNPTVVMALCLGGAVTNIKDSSGRTPLHHAFIRGMVRSVRVLLEQGADINAVDNLGNTVIDLVNQLKQKNFVIPDLDILLELYETINSPGKIESPSAPDFSSGSPLPVRRKTLGSKKRSDKSRKSEKRSSKKSDKKSSYTPDPSSEELQKKKHIKRSKTDDAISKNRIPILENNEFPDRNSYSPNTQMRTRRKDRVNTIGSPGIGTMGKIPSSTSIPEPRLDTIYSNDYQSDINLIREIKELILTYVSTPIVRQY